MLQGSLNVCLAYHLTTVTNHKGVGAWGSRARVEIKVEGIVGAHLMASGMSSEEDSGSGVTGFLPIYGSGLLGAS